MKRYILCVSTPQGWNAASKARIDAEKIAMDAGYAPFAFDGPKTSDGSLRHKLQLLLTTRNNWRRLDRSLEKDDVVLLQYPLYPLKTARLAVFGIQRLQKRKSVRFVALVHDLNSARHLFGKTSQYSDTVLLPLFDAVICHNAAMARWLASRGIPARRSVVLGPFDYLTDAPLRERDYENSICIAGNLSPEKCAYLPALIHCLQGRTTLHLYGQGADAALASPAVQLHGAFPSDELPAALAGAFGLVWDGDSADTCAGAYGQYLALNAPHKLSLYLAAGIPVVIWDKAAMAPLVKEAGWGITIASLSELSPALARVTPETYRSLCANVRRIAKLLRQGVALKTALKAAESGLSATPP